MNALRLLLGSCRRSVPLLSDPLMERHWAEQSALFGWSVAGLAGHFARSAFNLERAIEVAPAPDVRLMDVVDYYTCNEPQPADSTVGQRPGRVLLSPGSPTRSAAWNRSRPGTVCRRR